MAEDLGARFKSGIFQDKEQAAPISEAATDIVNLDRRLRVLEENLTNMRRRSQVTEQNILIKNRKFSTETKTIISELTEIKKEATEIKDRLVMVIKELQQCAKKEEVKVLEKYINMWEPINFVTKNDVEDIVRAIMKKESN